MKCRRNGVGFGRAHLVHTDDSRVAGLMYFGADGMSDLLCGVSNWQIVRAVMTLQISNAEAH